MTEKKRSVSTNIIDMPLGYDDIHSKHHKRRFKRDKRSITKNKCGLSFDLAEDEKKTCVRGKFLRFLMNVNNVERNVLKYNK